MQITADGKVELGSERIKKGGGLQGPDFYNCCGTGTRPTIYRTKRHKSLYFVGPEVYIDEAINAALAGRAKRVFDPAGRNPRFRVFIFQTSGPARRKFAELCESAIAENRRIAAAHKADAVAAGRGDVEAALRLGDY